MGCDIHTLCVVSNPETKETTAVRCNIEAGGESSRYDPADFRNYFVFGLLTDGAVRDSGHPLFNLSNNGAFPYEVDAKGDAFVERFMKNSKDGAKNGYHSPTYVDRMELTNLVNRLCVYRDTELKTWEDDEMTEEVNGAIQCLLPMVNYMDAIHYNLWLNGRQNDRIYMLIMFDS